ncbi:hypothetical protein KDW_48750 [Dictyobacter vulcani]|uniref:Uncharacterized protein n=1 Tax=Dictyobacter vulcani TaxID=2607529 RepID=A0A5J4KSR0_9CHLR|nr:hypothetical protein KDW_48750 [Dictyobacter vulcani]
MTKPTDANYSYALSRSDIKCIQRRKDCDPTTQQGPARSGPVLRNRNGPIPLGTDAISKATVMSNDGWERLGTEMLIA